MAKQFIAGIDIGGTKIAYGIGSADGTITARAALPTAADRSPEESMTEVFEKLALLAEARQGSLAAIGIGCPGPLDLELGVVLAPPNMPVSWREFPLRSFVTSRLGLPVVVDNDANVAALAEHLYGAGRGYTDLVYLTISTGIGGGIIANGQLAHRLGEAGHVNVNPGGQLCGCGARGCLEAECSGTAIARRAHKLLLTGRASSLREMVGDIDQVSARTVAEAAREGDEVACEVWTETVRLMANGIGSIIALLAPQAVILGGGVAAGAGDFLLRPLRAEVEERVRIVSMDEVQILGAALGADSGLYGGLALGASALR
jgi:glucokinase